MPVAFHSLRLRGVGERGCVTRGAFGGVTAGGMSPCRAFCCPPGGFAEPPAAARGCRRLREEAAGRGDRGRDRERTGGRRRWAGVGRAGDFFYSSCLFEEVRSKDVPASSQLPSHPPRCPPRCGGTIPTGTASSQVPLHPAGCAGILPSTMPSPSLAAWEPIP